MLSLAGVLPDAVLSLCPVVKWLLPTPPVPFLSFGKHLGAAECHQAVPTPGPLTAEFGVAGYRLKEGRQLARPTGAGHFTTTGVTCVVCPMSPEAN